MKSITVPLLTSLLTCSFILGISFGYYLTPEYKQMNENKLQMNFGDADAYVDLRYINAMIAHHRSAVLLAQEIEQKTKRDELLVLSKEIQTNEPKLIDELYTWKKDWFGDRRRVKDPQRTSLGASDEKVDLRFLNALLAHHQAGIVMTKEIRTKSSNAEVLNNADAVEAFLTASSKSLEEKRNTWYGIE